MSTPTTPATAPAQDGPSLLAYARLLAADTDSPSLTDDDWQLLLAARGATPTAALDADGVRAARLTAADALETISTSEALIGKVITTAAGVSTDGTKVAAELRARAAALRALVADTDLRDALAASGGCDVAPYGTY